MTKGFGGALLPGDSHLSSRQIIGGTLVSAVVGGTASVISGGKFSNGARTAAFQYLYNQASNVKTLKSKKIVLNEEQARRVLKYFYRQDFHISDVAILHAEYILQEGIRASTETVFISRLGAVMSTSFAVTSVADVLINTSIDLYNSQGDISEWEVLFGGNNPNNPYIFEAVRNIIAVRNKSIIMNLDALR